MEEYQRFLRRFRTKRFKKGEVILWQGQVPPSAYVVKTGVVKIYNLTSQGEEKPIEFNVANEIFPLAWVFSKAAHAQYYYEAFSNVEVYCLPPADFVHSLENRASSIMYVLRRMVERSIGFQLRINALERSKASSKITNMIHYLCLRFGKELKEHTVRVTIPLTQQDIANMTGLTRETTGQELKKLGEQGVVLSRRREYVVNTSKLNELLDEDYDLGLNGNKPALKA